MNRHAADTGPSADMQLPTSQNVKAVIIRVAEDMVASLADNAHLWITPCVLLSFASRSLIVTASEESPFSSAVLTFPEKS